MNSPNLHGAASLRRLAGRLGGFARRSPLLVAIAVGALPTVGVAMLWLTPYFETNDDPWMMLNLSGRATSTEPTPYVYFINIYLGRLLALAYRLAPAFPWYAAAWVAGIAGALSAMLYGLLLRGITAKRVLLFALCFSFCGLPFAINLQFTRVSFLVGLAGLLLLCAACTRRIDGHAAVRPTLARTAAAALLIGLSFSIRQDSFYLALLLSIPALTHLLWVSWRARALKTPLAALLAVGALLAALGIGHHRAYETDPEWRSYSELNTLKSWFIDYKKIYYSPETSRYFDEVGWSENDHRMMMEWFYVDPEIYSIERLRRLASFFPKASSRPVARATAAGVSLMRSMSRDATVWITLAIVASILCWEPPRRSEARMLLATAGTAVALLIALLVVLKLPRYVYGPVVSSLCWYALVLGGRQGPAPEAGGRRGMLQASGAICVVFAVLLMIGVTDSPMKNLVKGSRNWVEENAIMKEALREIAPRPSDTFISWGGGFPSELILPFEAKDYLRDLRLVSIGFPNRSPIQRRMLEQQGIVDVPRALFERDDVFLFLRDGGNMALLETYVREHYGIDVKARWTFRKGAVGLCSVDVAPG